MIFFYRLNNYHIDITQYHIDNIFHIFPIYYQKCKTDNWTNMKLMRLLYSKNKRIKTYCFSEQFIYIIINKKRGC